MGGGGGGYIGQAGGKEIQYAWKGGACVVRSAGQAVGIGLGAEGARAVVIEKKWAVV